MSRVAILTNDMQIAIANKHRQRRRAVKDFVPRMTEFLDKIRAIGIPIYHLQFILKREEGKTYDENYGEYPQLFKENSTTAILPEVLGKGDVIVEKHKDSGFFETELDSLLKANGVDTLVISGMQTQICVQTTAADAYFRGYNVIIIPEIVCSTRKKDTQASIKWMKNYFAKIMSMDEFLSYVKGE